MKLKSYTTKNTEVLCGCGGLSTLYTINYSYMESKVCNMEICYDCPSCYRFKKYVGLSEKDFKLVVDIPSQVFLETEDK